MIFSQKKKKNITSFLPDNLSGLEKIYMLRLENHPGPLKIISLNIIISRLIFICSNLMKSTEQCMKSVQS